MARKRLKCWKKVGKETWRNNSKRKVVYVQKVTSSKNLYDVYSDEPVIGAKSIKTLVRGKSSAIKSAKSYMRQHDRCPR